MSEILRRIDPAGPPLSNDLALETFLEHIEGKGVSLYPAQETAILELYDEKNVIQNTPTGSGKSMVATALHFKSLVQNKRSVYTCPIKALVNEKWLALCKDFGPENVGLSTGDATVNRDAPILCCTAEILANIALKKGSQTAIEDIIMDEFHYYSDRDRGVAWQLPLLTLPQSRFLLMSATLGNTDFFEEALTELNGKPTVTIKTTERPVPLEFDYRKTSLTQTIEALVEQDKCPLYVVCFSQREAAESAQGFTSINVCNKEEKQVITEALHDFKFNSPYGPSLKKWLKHGIGLHHAGLLPKYRMLVEQLAQKGLLKIICGTDTLGVGINVPIRTVVFTRLCKYDGQKTGIITSRDFHQIAGRAGRKGYDDRGWVVAQAPEHVIENLKLEQKAAKTGKKFVKRKPPERGFVAWDEKTFNRLIKSTPETLVSRFQVSHGMLINVLGRKGEDGCRVMRQLIRDCHDSPNQKKAHARRGWQLLRALLGQKIIQLPAPSESGRHIRVNVDLQEDFSMNQALSLYLHETLELMDPEAEDYALVVISLVESILEDPQVILMKQLDKIKEQALAAMKEEGLDYDQRMEGLEKLEYPKPNREFIYSTYNEFARRHPWVGEENIRPKSIVREMFEAFRSFNDYIKDYGLQRAEGLLLRHISSVYKTLTQTVPHSRKNDLIREIEIYLKSLIEQTDSSLMEEWEQMKDPTYQPPSTGTSKAMPSLSPEDITRDEKAFIAMIRQCVLSFLRGLALGDLKTAFHSLHLEPNTEPPLDLAEIQDQLTTYHQDHERIRLDPEARNQRYSLIQKQDDHNTWKLQQTLVDPEEKNDWFAEFAIDLQESKKQKQPAITFNRLYTF
ncbi:MAG: putative helicase HelY [Verrucomicrobia subdivision 3 bacterium]|nr:putative helicase HelY [Limisphaerales bacterium]MCS1413756.1 putative helicase HelY [Limisphaerales bacterium]